MLPKPSPPLKLQLLRPRKTKLSLLQLMLTTKKTLLEPSKKNKKLPINNQ
jgi:hypothetical protein